MKGQVDLSGSEDNDDGWAVTETSKRLKVRKEKEKLLLVISDGEPDNSSGHDGPEYELGTVVEKIIKDGEIKIVGLGLGSSGVSAVKQFYPKHLLANSAEEMIERIGDLLLEVIKG
jgi:cobalamin biosynthesis protein CobT